MLLCVVADVVVVLESEVPPYATCGNVSVSPVLIWMHHVEQVRKLFLHLVHDSLGAVLLQIHLSIPVHVNLYFCLTERPPPLR